LADAADAIGRGGLVVMPTDTVYGVAADPFNPSATERLFEVKRRPADLVLPVLVADAAQARRLAGAWPEDAEALASAFWPGPLTVIVPAAAPPALHLGGAGGTVGLRQPAHPAALALLRLTGPLAVSSANVSGAPPAVTAADAARQLGDGVALYLDAGRAGGQTVSSVVDLSAGPMRLTRAGGIGQAELETALGRARGALTGGGA
jgi:tRNA threonylcarbamoyl adenosine modification protein (Sua5/YciO/YrdC/YwlC family)